MDASADAAHMDARSDDDASSDLDAEVSHDATTTDAGMDATVDAGRCDTLVQMFESMGGAHVSSNEGVVYNSNPPSSGPHCGSWGQYTIFGPAKPLPRCNYIHNLEHGGVVLLYKCDGECPEVLAALTAVRDQVLDPECPGGKRVIITPDPNIDTLIAATAWQSTWTSDCIGASAQTSLLSFITTHLGGAGVAPESGICSSGSIAP